MELMIDGRKITAKEDQSLLTLIRQLDLDCQSLKERPLAAKIAGEVFNLNYVPLRSKDVAADRPSIRRAMAASGGNVQLLRYGDPRGKEVYTRTAQYVLFLALRQLWPEAEAKMNCTLGAALYIQVKGANSFRVDALKERVKCLVDQDIPLLRRRITTPQAVETFTRQSQTDKARLLQWRQSEHFDVYCYEDFMDYYYGELAPSTAYLQVWDILDAEEGFLFLFPDDGNPERLCQHHAASRHSLCSGRMECLL